MVFQGNWLLRLTWLGTVCIKSGWTSSWKFRLQIHATKTLSHCCWASWEAKIGFLTQAGFWSTDCIAMQPFFLGYSGWAASTSTMGAAQQFNDLIFVAITWKCNGINGDSPQWANLLRTYWERLLDTVSRTHLLVALEFPLLHHTPHWAGESSDFSIQCDYENHCPPWLCHRSKTKWASWELFSSSTNRLVWSPWYKTTTIALNSNHQGKVWGWRFMNTDMRYEYQSITPLTVDQQSTQIALKFTP